MPAPSQTVARKPRPGTAEAWWQGGVLYQIYPRSFADSNGDGIGDLTGVTERLEYLEWLGIAGIWLNPVTVSPNRDGGYDVADYCDVDPELGTLSDLDRLVHEAGARGIRVLLDLVPNHSSDQHAWFVEARSSPAAANRDWYVWADPRPDGSPPNNWRSAFGGPAWTLDTRTGQYYLHNFLPEQPDLNWWNEEVRTAFDEILRFWFDRGIAGFRIDVAHGIVKDRELRDNPPAAEADDEHTRRVGQRPVYSMNRPEVHDVLRRWRQLAERYDPPRVLVGETWVSELDRWAAFYGNGSDELHLAFNFPFSLSPLEAEPLRRAVEDTEAVIPETAWPVWTLSNHDIRRFPTRLCGEEESRVRAALLALLSLRGTPVLYYGDELGMPDVPIPAERARDPGDRDPCRTPMQWSGEPGAGFTNPSVEPWLPLGDAATCNVEAQRGRNDSILALTRRLIALRRELPDLRMGSYGSLPAPDDVWAWRRGERVRVAVNLGVGERSIASVPGVIAAASRTARQGEAVKSTLALGPWEGALVLSSVEDAV